MYSTYPAAVHSLFIMMKHCDDLSPHRTLEVTTPLLCMQLNPILCIGIGSLVAFVYFFQQIMQRVGICSSSQVEPCFHISLG